MTVVEKGLWSETQTYKVHLKLPLRYLSPASLVYSVLYLEYSSDKIRAVDINEPFIFSIHVAFCGNDLDPNSIYS